MEPTERPFEHNDVSVLSLSAAITDLYEMHLIHLSSVWAPLSSYDRRKTRYARPENNQLHR